MSTLPRKLFRADRAARRHFDALSPDEKVTAIYRMVDTGYSVLSIAAATKLSVEAVQQILVKRE